MKKPSPEERESLRSPLFFFVLPFVAGVLLSQYAPIYPTVPATLLAAGLLGFLVYTAPSSSALLPWHVPFFITVTCLGSLYGARFISQPPSMAFLLPEAPREMSVHIDPVQNFISPPYSDDQVGLASLPQQSGMVYYQSPAGTQRQPLPPGFVVELYGVPQPLETFVSDPDFLRYLNQRGATVGIESLLPGRILSINSFPKAVFSNLLEKSKSALSEGSSPLSSSTRVYQALVLGQRSGLSTHQKQAFRDTGTAHLFAISGLHVGLIGTLLFFLFGRLAISQPTQVICTLSILLFYVLLTGATPSAVRAFLMIFFLVGAKAFDRAYCPASALAASALVVLLIDPRQISTLGFQLSYIVVLSILVYGIPLAQTLTRRTDPDYWLPGQSKSPYHRIRKWFFASLSISLAAFLGSSCLIVTHFHILPFSSILLNLVLIIPATIALYFGFLSLFAGLLGLLWISDFLNPFAQAIIHLMTGMVSATAGLPFSAIPADTTSPWVQALGLIAFIVITFWTANQPRFRVRYLLLPISGLSAMILAGTTFS